MLPSAAGDRLLYGSSWWSSSLPWRHCWWLGCWWFACNWTSYTHRGVGSRRKRRGGAGGLRLPEDSRNQVERRIPPAAPPPWSGWLRTFTSRLCAKPRRILLAG